MENTVDHIDDFDDEFDEAWIDEIDESGSDDFDFDESSVEIPDDSTSLESSISSPKKKNRTPLIILILLSGGGFGAYKAHEMGMFSTSPRESIPVVQLSEDATPIISKNEIQDESPLKQNLDQATDLDSDPITNDLLELREDTLTPIETTQGDVLTPMPENIGGSHIELPNLNTLAEVPSETQIVDAPQIESAPVAPTTVETSSQKILDEDALITKTESVFENDDIQPLEEVSITEPVIEKAPVEYKDILDLRETHGDDVIIEETVATPTITEVSPIPNKEPPVENVEDTPKEAPSHSTSSNETNASTAAKIVETVQSYKPVWSIRAAQPGRAVIREKKTGEMKSVEVGDTVNGLGRIKSIAKHSNQWVIKGTSGTVTQ